ncbi:hypothetical protein D9M71_829190 [compost metagenome]
MDDLGEAEDRILIGIVEAMDEDHRMAAVGVLAHPFMSILNGFYWFDAYDGKISLWIRRQFLRPLHRSRGAKLVGWDGDGNIRDRWVWAAFP